MQDDLKAACDVLLQGGLILYPTDTIWGIGCDAANERAVERIYTLKKRHDEKSMLVLLDNEEKLTKYVAEVPEIAWDILAVADKPLTIVYPGARNLAKNLIADDGSLGLRITSDEFCKKLIARFGKPVVSTSANVSGKPWPANFHEIDKSIAGSVDYVVKWRQNEQSSGRPSGIVKIGLRGEIRVLRE